MEQPPLYLYLIGAAVILASLALAIWPAALVSQYERMAAQSTDALAAASRRSFDPAVREKNVGTFRLVGILGALLGCVLVALVSAARV